MRILSPRLPLVALLVLAFAARIAGLGDFPPGLYHDEAFYGLDAAGILAGDLKLYFPANNGREPLFVYLVAGFVAILGHTPAAVRLAAAFAGVAAVAAAYACGTALFGRRVGLITAALMAVAPWPVMLGRVGFRAGTLPLVLALAVAATARGAHRDDRRWVALGGVLAGLTLYTYTAARVLPLLVLACLVWMGIAGRLRLPQSRRMVAAWLAMAIVVAAPLLATFARDPSATVGRSAQVSILNPDINGGAVATALARNLGGTLGMVAVRGDFIPRHNIPNRPVLGWLGAGLWIVGLVVIARRARRESACAFLLLWLTVLALPTVLAENAPHFLRAAGLLPAIFMPAAIGIEALSRRWFNDTKGALILANGLVGIVLGFESGAMAEYARHASIATPTGDTLRFAFEAAASDLARDVNAARGAGWRGGWAEEVARDEVAASPVEDVPSATSPGAVALPGSAPRVWLDRRFRDGWASVPFLVDTQAADVKLNDPYDKVFTKGPGTAFLWPYALDLDSVWAERAPGLRYDFADGPLSRGDLDAAARPLFLRIDATPADVATAPLARFADGMRLDGAVVRVRKDGHGLEVVTTWSTEQARTSDVTAFFQVLDGNTVVAGSDAPLGRGLLPTSRWRAGEQVVERRAIDVPGGVDAAGGIDAGRGADGGGRFDVARHRVIAGIYVWPSVERVKVVGEGAGDGGAGARDSVALRVMGE